MSINIPIWLFLVYYILAGIGFAGISRALIDAWDMDYNDEVVWTMIAFFWLTLPMIGIVALIEYIVAMICEWGRKRGESGQAPNRGS